VLDIKDEEAVVVRLLGLDAHREAARRGVGFVIGADGCVDSEDGGARRGVGQVLCKSVSQQLSRFIEELYKRCCLFFGNIVNETPS
jgi:hypothetical protein